LGMAGLFTEDEVRAIVAEATAPLLARIAELEAESRRLLAEVARLKKDSTTSSKPPSSDIVKPPRQTPGGGKRRTDMRAGMNGVMYILSTGCQWRCLPKEWLGPMADEPKRMFF